MATVSFSQDSFGSIEVPSRNLMGVFQPQTVVLTRAVEEIISSALANPLGSPRLSDLAGPGQRVLILVDDYTRMTPANLILPPLLEELFIAGVREEDITFLVSLGTHRPMTEAEMVKKLGKDIVDRFQVKNHTWSDPHQLLTLGATTSGVEIEVNRLATECDLLIGLGHIVPHRVAGYSGGGKIVQPGICGARTTGQTHWLSALYSGPEILGVVENPVREAIDAVAQQIGLRFIVNAVQDAEGKVVEVVAGQPVEAHRAGCRIARGVFAAEMPERADVVVAEAYPSDFDLWQGAKAVYSSELALKAGGTIVLLADCPEGVAGQHSEVEAHGYLPVQRVKDLVESGALRDLTCAAHIAHVGRATCDLGRCIIVSRGIGPETAKRLGFDWAETPQKALDKALAAAGTNASVAVLKHGGELLPVIRG